MIRASSRELVYLGWQSNNNFGDELIYDFWKAALNRPLDIEAPLTLKRYLTKQIAAFLPDRVRLVGRERAILLGGGTTVGFGTWARHARLAQRMYGTTRVLAAGAGAAERGDEFTLSRQPHEWQAWRDLQGFELLGVRGPLTSSACAAELQPSPVIGDPALAYPHFIDVRRRPRNVIGLCLGSEGSSRFEIAEVAEGVQQAAANMGAEIVLFQMTDADAPVNEQLRRVLGDVDTVVFDGDVLGMMEQIAACAAFVSERLHGTIAAVALGVAATPLPYASKCDDFWLSVCDERPSLTPQSAAVEIAQAVLASRDPIELERISERVAVHRAALIGAAARISQWLDGGAWPEVNR
ncbi:polysaccharide pyruvyl transferase family protein [Leucobacter japonicus]|uniref:polysaccharide pyruvyl transferase family protein n=1 Tax=Leucobacter japonicus TaxID=1461259 RepID=UPI0006A76024|nr:polysaccharide pyruvyl transferase family protein [Leucobacter japonicus]